MQGKVIHAVLGSCIKEQGKHSDGDILQVVIDQR